MIIARIAFFVMPFLFLLCLPLMAAALILFAVSLWRGMDPGRRYGFWLLGAAAVAFICPWILAIWFWKDFVQKAPMAELIIWRNVTFASYLILPWIGIYFGRKCILWSGRTREEPVLLRLAVGFTALGSLCVHVFCLVAVGLVVWEIVRALVF